MKNTIKNTTQKEILEDFLKKIIENSKNIDSEYVDIVNKNFWDLI